MSVKVIAEFCQNHNGDFAILQEMIHQAAEAGATYGKIQTIFADSLAYRERFEEGVVENGKVVAIKRPYKLEYDRLKGLELTYEQEARFITDCCRYGLIPLTTCFTRGDVKRLAEMGWSDIKVASYDCGSLPLISELAEHFKHIIVSTGATYDDEIAAAAMLLKEKSVAFSFLHCVTIYPTPLHEMHLRRLKYLRQFTPQVGLSCHGHVERDGVKADLAAVYLGATLIERHFTVLPADKTRDGPVSIRKEHIKQIVDFSRMSQADQKLYIETHIPEFEAMLGKETRDLSEQELLNRDYYRGRFATRQGAGMVYNWENTTLEEIQ